MDTSAAGETDQEETRTTSGGKGPTRAYAPAVLDERQPKLTDLIPLRPFVLAMLGLIGLTVIASIEAVYIHLYQPRLGGVALRGVDLAQRGSLAQWFSSVMLLAGACLSLVVYSIRVHRIDDYRGRYRIWLWTSGALVLGSLATVTGVHESLNAACVSLSGTQSGLSNHLWLAIYGTLFGGIGLWLAAEVWPSLQAFLTLAVAAALYMLATAAHVGLLPLEGTLLSVVSGTTALMLAHGTLFYALTLFARHVHLDAQGRLMVNAQPVKRKKAKSRAKLAVVGDDAEPKRKKAASKSAATQEGESEAKPAGASISTATLKSPAGGKQLAVAKGDDDDEGEDDEGSGKMSRAERRRLKKLAEQGGGQQQRRAA